MTLITEVSLQFQFVFTADWNLERIDSQPNIWLIF